MDVLTECAGSIERGFAFVYEGFDKSDVYADENSHHCFGLLLITNVELKHMVDLSLVHPDKFIVVDHISDTATIIKLMGPKMKEPFLIHRGPRPCIVSITELQQPPHGQHWYHFQYLEHSAMMGQIFDWFYEQLPEPTIFWILDLVPFKYIFVLNRNPLPQKQKSNRIAKRGSEE